MGERRKAKRQVKLLRTDNGESKRHATAEVEFRSLVGRGGTGTGRGPSRLRSGYPLLFAQEDDEHSANLHLETGVVQGLLVSLHQRVAAMNVNLSSKLEEMQVERDTCSQLQAIRLQLVELARTVESCQGEVADIKKDVVAIKCDIESLQATKEEIEELRDCVERLEEQHRRRRIRLLEQGLTCHLVFAIFAAVLGMFQFGYNTGVINSPLGMIKAFISKTNMWHRQDFIGSVAVSIFAIGGMIGGFLGGTMANRFGRKRSLMFTGILGIAGGVLMGLCKSRNNIWLLVIGRFIIGLNCGLYTSLAPMYVSEIAPINLRGGLGTVNQLAVTIGILLSQILGIPQIWGTEDGWPVLLALAVCPPALQMILLLFCPESPRYLLITRGWEDLARAALIRLRNSANIEDDIEEMRAEERAQQEEATITMCELVRSRLLRLPLVIAIVMQLSQQLSGIVAVFYYSTNLFQSSGLSEEAAKYANIGVGAVMVLNTIVSIPLMDRAGRRTLMLYGLGGMFIFSIFITISLLVKVMISGMTYLSVASVLCFVVFFAIGPGSIPWMITTELFSQGPRPAAVSIATLVNWFANFVVGISFPGMQVANFEKSDDYTFLPFTVLLAFFWVFTYKKVPETKNKTFEEILMLFRRDCDAPTTLNSMPKIGQMRENSSLIASNQSDYGLQENAV